MAIVTARVIGDGLLRSKVNFVESPQRLHKLLTVAAVVVALLFVKVLLTILYEYRWYFPANFDSAYLSGRRDSFVGVYRAAFYAHIITGPVAVMLSAFLMFSGGRAAYRQLHRWAGRTLGLLAILVVGPSGFVMALQTHAGPIAVYGFATLSIGTGVCAMMAVNQARARKFRSHQRWANRCFILLCSPLLLRLISGAVIVLQVESEWTYQLNAWLSWLIPLAIYEFSWRLASGIVVPAPIPLQSFSSSSAFP